MKMRNSWKRSIIQTMAAILCNANFKGFTESKIYTGKSKMMCVPGLNCYSCPGAVGSCPIGAVQAVLGGRDYSFAYYVVGILLFFGVVFGRLICGFLCPFGFIQDLLFKIGIPKIKVPKRLDKALRFVKYGMLLIPVFLLPIFLTNQFGMASPYFCQWICPVGTLEGGIPLITYHESLRQMIGFLFHWKVTLLVLTIILSILIYRPFCKYFCPLGAFYSLLNRFSFYQMQVDRTKCNKCRDCERACKMNVEIIKNINSLECIRCGECKDACNKGAIYSGFLHIRKKNKY
ncbi:MAG: 4Fe-4S binding protein [Anaerovorax sp.]|nr:4Fe-4S binding protein [Anaerovorax sp.]